MTDTKQGLALLREPFPPNQISKLPKPMCPLDEWKNLPKGKCNECHGYHALTKTFHLDYVGHAALTDRLLDADPNWTWEPMGVTESGLPRFDEQGGLWIRLTVCGVSRLGYGNAGKKTEAGNREKEVIGDALRNAAMRFGAALELWHKGQLHDDDDEGGGGNGKADPPPPAKPKAAAAPKPKAPGPIVVADLAEPFDLPDHALAAIKAAKTVSELRGVHARCKASPFQGEDVAMIREAMTARRNFLGTEVPA